jgi:SAM-dependent methyltransferase
MMTRITARAIADWSDPSQPTVMTADEATYALHALGPRVRFIKTLPIGASMLDAGAGNGSSTLFRTWPAPERPDLAMFAWSGEPGEFFDRFDGHEIGYWPQRPPGFGGRTFDAVLCANFIEHIDDPLVFIRHCIGRLTRRARLYLEWPRPESIDLPSTEDLAAAGVPVTTGRYHDDCTHRAVPPTLQDVVNTLTEAGLRVTEQGIVRVPMIDQQVAIHARRSGDRVGMTLAYWSVTGWCQYLAAEVG